MRSILKVALLSRYLTNEGYGAGGKTRKTECYPDICNRVYWGCVAEDDDNDCSFFTSIISQEQQQYDDASIVNEASSINEHTIADDLGQPGCHRWGICNFNLQQDGWKHHCLLLHHHKDKWSKAWISKKTLAWPNGTATASTCLLSPVTSYLNSLLTRSMK